MAKGIANRDTTSAQVVAAKRDFLHAAAEEWALASGMDTYAAKDALDKAAAEYRAAKRLASEPKSKSTR